MDDYIYYTKAGDTFDLLALRAYGDEYKAGDIITANPDYVGTLVFPSGVAVHIPLLGEETPATLPPWKR